MDFFVFLSDFDTFSPLENTTIVTTDGKSQYDLKKLLDMVTPSQLEACKFSKVNRRSRDALKEDGG